MYTKTTYLRVITSDRKRFFASHCAVTHKFGHKSYIFVEAFKYNSIWILARADIKSIKAAKYSLRYDSFKVF